MRVVRVMGALSVVAVAFLLGWLARGAAGQGRTPRVPTVEEAARGTSSVQDGDRPMEPTPTCSAPPLLVSSAPDGGSAGAPADLESCFRRALREPEEITALVREFDSRARARCMVAWRPRMGERASPDPRSPCGDLSEELWSESNDSLGPLLRAIRDLSSAGQPSGVFAGVDCESMSDEHFAAAAHFGSMAPRWVAPRFLTCALMREARGGHEGFALWSLLDALRINGGPVQAMALPDQRRFHDPRTLRRLDALTGAPQQPADRLRTMSDPR